MLGQRNAIKLAFRWRADDGPILVVFGEKKRVGPHLKNFLGPRMSSLGGIFFLFLF